MVSGYSSIGYLAKDEWNPYYKLQLGRPVHPLVLAMADRVETLDVEYIQVMLHQISDEVLNEEGD
jgi:hypothetical protein